MTKLLLHLAIFISGLFKTVFEIYPIYIFSYLPKVASGIKLHQLAVIFIGGLLILGGSLDLWIKYLQILILYFLYISARKSSLREIYKLHCNLYIILTISVVLSINPVVQDILFKITRSYASAGDLLDYTGGVAGFSPEPSYMGSLLGGLLLSIFGLRAIEPSFGNRNLIFFIISHGFVLLLLKSIMAFIFFLPSLAVFFLLQRKAITIPFFIILIATVNYWLPALDSLNRIDSVLSEVGNLNVRPDAELGSNRGFIIERVIDNLGKFGFVFTRALPQDFEKAVGIADFLAITIAPLHPLALFLIIYPFGVKKRLKIIYIIMAASLCFWTPTLLAFHAFALGAIKHRVRSN